jgi:methionine-rich copper-binding protein CopC
MKKITFIIILILIMVLSSVHSVSSGRRCSKCCEKKPTKECCDEFPWVEICQQGRENDNADDNFSYSTDNGNRFYFITPDVLIYRKGHYEVYENNNLGENEDAFTDMKNSAEVLLNSGKVIIFPTGSLFGKDNDSTFKTILHEYVQKGGNIIVFGQQFGRFVDAVLPKNDGDVLRSYGWRESNSCIRDSSFFESFHPALASLTKANANVSVDGYFSSIPGNSEVLLRAAANKNPVLFTYKCGFGSVTATSMFTDWAYSHSQASRTELNLVRDVIAYAKNPNLPISSYNVTDNPNLTITLPVTIKNHTQLTASKVQITVYTPDRDIVLFETLQGISLAPGAEEQIQVTFTLPSIQNNFPGICHTDYQLYAAEEGEDILIQLFTEADSGRFALHQTPEPYIPTKEVDMWVTTESEFVYWDSKPKMTVHIKNNSGGPISNCSLRYDWWHFNSHDIPGSFSLGAGEYKAVPFEAEFGVIYNRDWTQELCLVWLSYINSNGNYKGLRADKSIRVLFPRTASKLSLPTGQKTYRFGFPIDYQFNILNETGLAVSNIYGEIQRPIDVNIKLSVVKGYWNEEEMDIVYSSTTHLEKNGSFAYPGSYTPAGISEPGYYRFKLEVEKPDGKKEIHYRGFYYYRSSVRIETYINDDPWFPGHIYTVSPGEQLQFKIKLTNFYDMNITKGKYIIKAVSKENNRAAFSKEVDNISLAGNEQKVFEESFVFTPPEISDYIFSVEYTDETRPPTLMTVFDRSIRYQMHARLAYDQPVYHYQDTANVGLHVQAVGKIQVKFKSVQAGIDEAFDVDIPVGSPFYTKTYSIPLTSPQPYDTWYQVLDEAGNSKGGQGRIYKKSLLLSSWGQSGGLSASTGNPFKYTLIIKELSGVTTPVNGVLVVSSGSLPFNESRPVTVLPGVSNTFDFDIPIPESAAQGVHQLNAQFLIDGVNYLQQAYDFRIDLPGFILAFAPLPYSNNAGDTLTLKYTNIGGRSGSFDILVKVHEKGKTIVEHEETLQISAGEQQSLEISLPTHLKTGYYSVNQTAAHELSGKNFYNTGQVHVTGVSAALNTYTLKEKYFDTENVSGKAEISSGSGNIENGVLHARIIRHAESKGVEEEAPGEFIPYNMIENGYSSGNMLYLVTDKGVLNYDVVSGNVNMLYSFDTNPGFNSKALLLSAAGELWIASAYDGVWKQSIDGQWQQYTTVDGLADDWTYNIIEVNGSSGSETWAATYGGISVFRNNQWVNYNTANGLPSNRVYKLALDGNGAVWASTSGGVVKFNGTNFESIGAPFGSTSVSDKMTGTADGSVWLVASGKLYRYQPGSDQWNQWNIDDLCPTTFISPFIWEMGTVNGQLWMRIRDWDAEDNPINGLIVYNGSFISYTNQEIPGLSGLDTTPIIPGNAAGDSAYFACEVGFMAFDSSTWQHKVINMDSSKFCGEIQCLTADSLGRLWAGTDYGFSMHDGSQWTNYYSIRDSRLIFDVMLMDTDAENRVYGYCSPLGGILKLEINNNNQANIQLIEFPYSLGFYPQYDDKMAVDTHGRIWLGRKDLYYYDTEGEWHKYEGVRYVKCMIKDFNGGVWLGSRTSPNDASGAEFHLVHIKNDFTFDDYTTSNSGLIHWEKDRLYLDQNGVLWIKHYAYNYSDKRSLQSFDGSNWIDYSNFTGFPALGAQDFVKDNNNRLHIVDPEGVLYVLQDNEFVLEMEQSYYSHSLVWWQDRLRCVGYTGDTGGGGEIPTIAAGLTALTSYNNFLTLSGAAGVVEEEFWSQSYQVNLLSGGMVSIDLITGKTFPPGAYELKTSLLSPLQQELSAGDYGFVVKDAGLSVSLFADCSPCGFLKPDTDLGITVEVLNNTSETKSNLIFGVKKISPDGTEEVVLSNTFTLAPGQLENYTLNFNESTTGTWKLVASLSDTGSGEEKESTLFVGVTEPIVSTAIQAPEYAGDESFDVKINLVNDGNILAAAQLTVQASGDGNSETPIDESIILAPREERMFTVNDTLSANKDKSYTISLTGDVQQTETKTVKYGYIENFNIDVLPVYREGVVSIEYTIANGGGMAFVDNLHVELVPVGGTVPIHIIDKSFNLYPGDIPISDSLVLDLAPGNYLLNYSTSRTPGIEVPITVQPSGIGTVTFPSPPAVIPLGLNNIAYTIANSDTVAGNIEVVIELKQGTSTLMTETRGYFLEPLESKGDIINYNFAEKGTYTLIISGNKLNTPINAVIQAVPLQETSSLLSIGPVAENQIPVDVSIANTGYNEFKGSIIISSADMVTEEQLSVLPGAQFNGTVGLSTTEFTPGKHEVKAYLYHESGELLAETSGQAVITGSDIQMVEFPGNLEIDAGGFTEVIMKIKNQGHLRGSALLRMTAFDNLNQETAIILDPGEEIEISDVYIDAAADIPTGNYPFNYTLSGSGVENGLISGNFSFKVLGVSLDAAASFDKDYYNEGEIAALQLTVTSLNAGMGNVPLEAQVNWGNYSEKQSFNLVSGSQQLVFHIPLDEAREEKVFYGIYHQEGKGIHLNDIYLRFGGETGMVLDQQVYALGEIIHAVFTSSESGVLTASSFDETHTVPVSSSAAVDFAVPEDTPGGSYGVSWQFIPADTSHETKSGSVPFDVSGLVVKVAKSVLEKGKYSPGETIRASYTFESNSDETLTLRCWTTTPTGEWEYLGESSAAVSAASHVNAVSSYNFTTTESGTHHLVYGLYKVNQLVVSGSMAFDVGNAVLIDVTTDQYEYKNGNETVNVTIEYFGEGNAMLELYMDEEKIEERSLTLSGPNRLEILLNHSQVRGGSHSLEVVLTGDGLKSTKTTNFTYGTYLPDLIVTLDEYDRDGLSYSYKVEVSNVGKTASASTSLVFTANGTAVETVSIPALEPDNYHQHTFIWSGTGKAGSNELMFEVDKTNAVKEFSETNNQEIITEEVPEIFYTLGVEPEIWPANTNITIVTRVINNRENSTQLILDLSLSNNSSGEIIFQRSKVEEIAAFASKTINDNFNTGVYPAGEYTLSQTLSGENVSMHEDVFVIVEVTKVISGTLQVQPQQIPANTTTDVQLTMALKNTGNVPLENEILQLDVFHKEGGEVVQSEEVEVSIPWAEEITETKTMSLNLVEGNYEIWLKHNEEILALADLSAISAVKPTQTIGIYPRVLIIDLNEKFLRGAGAVFSKRAPAQFLTALLQSQGIEYEIGVRLLDSYVKLNKGQANVNIVLGNEMGGNLRDELKEKVFHGEGLILFCDKPAQNPEWVDFLGVTIKPIPGKTSETVIQILPNEFCSEGEFECAEELKLQMIKEKEDVVIIAQTKQRQYPVMAYRKYGKGHILMAAVPLEFKSGIEYMSQLLLNTITFFSLDIYTGSDLTRLLPLELSLKNESSEAAALKIKTFLPYGVEAFDFKPEPEEGEELEWTITIPAVSTKTISYWLKLPDQVNSFEIRTELYEEVTKLDEVSTTFEVIQTVLYRINELILELDMTGAVGKDARLISKAKHHLEQTRNRTGNSFMEHLLNLLDSVKAAAYLGEVKSIDVSPQRLKTQDIMIIMGRRFYEAVKTWDEVQLNPILELL